MDTVAKAAALLEQALKLCDDHGIGLSAAAHIDLSINLLRGEARSGSPPARPAVPPGIADLRTTDLAPAGGELGGATPAGLFAASLARAWPLSHGDEQRLVALELDGHRLGKGETIGVSGPAARSCLVLRSGIAMSVRGRRASERRVVALHFPGELVGLDTIWGRRVNYAVQAITEISFVSIDAAGLADLVASVPNVAHAVASCAATDAAIGRRWLANDRASARARVAHFVLEYGLRSHFGTRPPRDSFVLEMTLGLIGKTLGLTAVHVGRVLRSLQDDGLIERRGARVTVKSWAALKRVAKFDEGYLNRATAAFAMAS